MRQKNQTPDIDGSWKGLITNFFPDFIAFFMSNLYGDVDFTRPPEFLEQEFRSALRPLRLSKKGKKITDKLVKVYLKDGTEKWILWHIEIQHTPEALFSRRIFLYYTLISMRYPDKDIVTLVIFTGHKLPVDYNVYKRNCLGTILYFRYNTYAVINPTEKQLLRSKNIFALAVIANKYLLESEKSPKLRLEYKKKVYELGRKNLKTLDEIEYFINFADEMLILQDKEETDFQQYFLYNFNSNTMETAYKRPTRMSEILFRHEHDGLSSKEWSEKIKKDLYAEAEKAVEKAAEKATIEAHIKAVKATIHLYYKNKLTIEEIADTLSLSTDQVNDIIQKYLTENPPT
jgi:hypothetical protein